MLNKVLLLALLVTLLAPPQAFGDDPQTTLKSSIDAMLQVLQEPGAKGTAKYQQDREALTVIIKDVFDFHELSARAVGLHWKRFNPEEQEQFVQAFTDLLSATYMDRIQAYKNEQVIYGAMRQSETGNVEIDSIVVQGAKRIPMSYRMTQTAKGWRVYDVIIEGVSLVKNYRTQFLEIMVNGTPADLINAVRTRVGTARSGSLRLEPERYRRGLV